MTPESGEEKGMFEETSKQQSTSATSGAGCEREALLRAVADCWPEAQYLVKPIPNVALPYRGDRCDCGDRYDTRRWRNLFLRGNDVEDAEAIILMLDEMERRGYTTALRNAISELALDDSQEDTFGEYVLRPGWYELWINHKQGQSVRQEHFGKTRAEAVAKAFAAVLQHQEEQKS